MSAREVVLGFQAEEGWTDATVIELLCQFIDGQKVDQVINGLNVAVKAEVALEEYLESKHIPDRSEYEAQVAGPGKFEGEQAYVPYFYEQYLDGGADEDDGDVLTFNVTEDDRFVFPELDKDVVRIREDDNGFVHEV